MRHHAAANVGWDRPARPDAGRLYPDPGWRDAGTPEAARQSRHVAQTPGPVSGCARRRGRLSLHGGRAGGPRGPGGHALRPGACPLQASPPWRHRATRPTRCPAHRGAPAWRQAPADRRASRARLRRRRHWRRPRAARRPHGQHTQSPSNRPESGRQSADTTHRDGGAARLAAPAGHNSLDGDLARLGHDAAGRRDGARSSRQAAKPHDANTRDRRRTVPRSGELLSLGLRSERHAIPRFPRGQAGVASGRLGTCATASAGTRHGPAGTQRGPA
jgi:hypothetical protein